MKKDDIVVTEEILDNGNKLFRAELVMCLSKEVSMNPRYEGMENDIKEEMRKRLFYEIISGITSIKCPFFYWGTDCVHPVIVGKCNHPDKGGWK